MSFCFTQVHIDAARNATDDFNLFHDKQRWAEIRNNPFQGPIVLGFQLGMLIEDRLRHYRQAHDEARLIEQQGLHYSNYQFTFVNAVRPGMDIELDIKKTHRKNEQQLSNRVLIKHARQGIMLMGTKTESRQPLFLANADLSTLPDLDRIADRSFLSDWPFFLKRKFLTTANGKNFLLGSLVEQSDYFDELEDKICFPEMYPLALLSCALLERAHQLRHDFRRDPMVYISHHISIDRRLVATLASNDRLNMLVEEPQIIANAKGIGVTGLTQHRYHCYGLLSGNRLLYRAEMSLIPLAEMIRLK